MECSKKKGYLDLFKCSVISTGQKRATLFAYSRIRSKLSRFRRALYRARQSVLWAIANSDNQSTKHEVKNQCRRDFHITPSGTGRSAAINQWAHSSVQHCSPTRYNRQLEATSDKRRSHFSSSPGYSRTRNTFCILKQSPLSLEEQRVFFYLLQMTGQWSQKAEREWRHFQTSLWAKRNLEELWNTFNKNKNIPHWNTWDIKKNT